MPTKRVCFFGDSITCAGVYIKELEQRYLDKGYGDDKIEFYNSGVPGDSAGDGLKRIEECVLTYKPDVVFVMFGMNDIGRNFYVKAHYCDDDEIQRSKYIGLYKERMTLIANKLSESGAEVVLCTPTPFDDVSEPTLECNLGLEKCAEIVRNLAKEKKFKLVDHFKNMGNLRTEKYWGKNDPVHPNELGHHVMAESLMYDLGYIDKMDIETPISDFDDTVNELCKASYAFGDFIMLERSMLREGLTSTEEKLERAAALLDKQTDEWWKRRYRFYIENCGKGSELKKKMETLVKELSEKSRS